MMNIVEFDIDVKDHMGKHGKHEFLSDRDANICNQLHVTESTVKDLTIVLVGDNKYLLKFLNDSLSLSYFCYEARNGREGFGLITKIIPDMVISEVNLPKINGYELCERIKETPKTCHIPIILLTDQNESIQMASGYERGADACVAKPIEMNILKALTLRLIKNRELIKSKYIAQNFMVEISSDNLKRDNEFIVRLRQLLEENLSDFDFNVQELSFRLNMSNTTLYRKIKTITGLSSVEFMLLFKMQKAYDLLSTSESIKSIGYGLGFKHLSYFSRCFKKQFGVTPFVFRQKGFN